MGTVSRCGRCARTWLGGGAWACRAGGAGCDRPRGGGEHLMSRLCSRPACRQPALYTLTYVYRDSTAVLGPLATYVEPHCYDLCAAHAGRLTAPRGWDVVRLPVDPADPDPAEADDLEALANAVREAVLPSAGVEPVGQGIEVSRRGHLRVLRSSPEERDQHT